MAQSAGRVGFLLKGSYDPEETYEFLDVITHRRSSYITKKTAKGIEPPNDEYYQLAAAGAGASYGTSSTAGDASVKTVATVGGFSLDAGASVIVKFENDDTAGNVALDIDGTGAKPVHLNGQAVAAGAIKSDTVYEFVYDGTGYAMVSGMGGGAGGSVITVTTNKSALYGRGVTITDGTDTASSAFDQAGKATFRSVMMTGTLTVSATDGESAVTGTMQVPYFGNYEYKLAFWEADITVRTDTDEFDGSTVTVKKDGVAAGTTVFSGGSASYVAPEPGSYTFECTLGWKTFTSAAVSVTEETSYNAILNGFVAPIAVSTASEEFYGATVNVPSNGSAPATAIAFDSSGNASYTAYEPGTYTFTVTYNGNDYSGTVTVSEETAYSVNVNYWTATLSITTPTAQMRGKAVTVKDANSATVGTVAFGNEGTASFAVHAPGTYTFECTLGWRTFTSSLVVSEETSYSVEVEGFVANISVASKSEELAAAAVTVTCTGVPTQTVTLPVLLPGSVSYTAYMPGTYTFLTEYDGKTYSSALEVTAQGDYTVNINTHNDVAFAFHYSENDSNPASVTYPAGYTNSGYTKPFAMNLSTGVPDYGDWNPNGAHADDVKWLFPRSCMLKFDGTVDYYLDENDETKKEDGTASDVANASYAGNAMMEWGQDEDNPIYWKIMPDADGKGFTFVVCNYEMDGDVKPWNHYNCKGEVAKHFYTPKYFGSVDSSGRLRSISGGTNYVNNNAEAELTAAKKNNQTSDQIWNTEVYADWLLLGLLEALLGKSMNTQTTFGSGRSLSSNTSAIGQGTMNGKGMFYGKSNGTEGVKIFGMENPHGNLWRRIAGLINDKGTVKIKLTYGKQDGSTVDGYNTTGAGYITHGTTGGGTNGGYISHMNITEKGLTPNTTSGSETTYYSDSEWFNNDRVDYALVGGFWYHAGLVGAFCCALYAEVLDAYMNFGAAISCKPRAA